jgi:ectoine hydroxylase-related dioxygenase (phytanoyl-CoA dioxygenase family)
MSTEDLLKKFERDGYIVLKKAILKNECKKLIKNTIVPILHKKQIYLSKSESWINKDNTKKHGQLIYGPKGGHIISKNNKHYRFPALFQSKKLNYILDIIHSRNKKKKWEYNHLAKQGLGWIHLRYPYYNYENKEKTPVKCPKNSFHLDGLNYKNEINTKQSVVLLPFITTINKNEGGTAVIPGSHKLINNYILRQNYKTNKNLDPVIDNIVIQNPKKIIDIIGDQGDILIMHPHLVHSPSYADINSKVRITFNLSTKKL